MGSETFELEALRIELRELGASMVQRQLFETNVDRGRSAIAQAYDRGAGNPLSYAISLFRSETFMPDPKRKPQAMNAQARTDPTRTDDGERIWQAEEVDEAWRAGYLLDCWAALHERREPAARYSPSEDEFDAWLERMKPAGYPIPPNLDPKALMTTALRAIRVWAELWGVELPVLEMQPAPELVPSRFGLAWRAYHDPKFAADLMGAEDPEPVLDDDAEPMIDDPEPVIA